MSEKKKKKKGRKIPFEERWEIIDKIRRGEVQAQIARDHGIPASLVSRLKKKYSLFI